MTIKLKFRLPVPSSKVTAVVTASEAIVAQQVQDRGEDTQLLVDNKGPQAFKNVVNNVGIAVRNLPPQRLVWEDLRDVLNGLARYCANQECMYELSVGSGAAIGRGHLSKGY